MSAPIELRHESIASIVLGTRSSNRAPALGVGLLGAAMVYAWIAAATFLWSVGDSAPPMRSISKPLKIEHLVDLVAPPAPQPPSQSAVIPTRPRARAERAARSAAPPRPDSGDPPAAAVAAPALAAEPRATTDPLDFTGFDIATGQGLEFAGGITAPSGTGTRGMRGAGVGGTAHPGTPAGTGRHARGVGLPATDWSCPWPAEAEVLSIDEETVVIRVAVRPDGTVDSADLVTDPGHGFGAVALACAHRQRFPPALDEGGHPVLGTSPPVRVHFTRSR